MDNLQELMIESIKAHAQSSVRFESLELAISNMRSEYKDIQATLNAMSRTLSIIEENQRHNEAAHGIIHKRIDDVKVVLDGLIDDHSPCKSLSKAAVENKDRHKDMERRITDIQNNCKNCPASGYKELAEQMEATKVVLQVLCSSLAVVNYKIGRFPLWLILVVMILIGFVFDINSHREWIMKAWEVWK